MKKPPSKRTKRSLTSPQTPRVKRHRGPNRSGVCERCTQYVEDCTCCPECNGVEVHTSWCDRAATKEFKKLPPVLSPLAMTLVGLGEGDAQQEPEEEKTEYVAPFVVRIDDSTGPDSTAPREISITKKSLT